MAYSLRNSNQKRQAEIDQGPKAKNQKSIGVEDNATNTEIITNICNEIIERIFDHLDPQSLLNVAGTCKRLQTIAAAKYGQKFSSSGIVLYLNSLYSWGSSCPKQGCQFDMHQNIHVYPLSTLPFLRYFGAHIPELFVQNNRNQNGLAARYINQYCADTLTMLKFLDNFKVAFTMENFPKPFKMVETVTLMNFAEQFSNFAYWFPSLRQLRFTCKWFDFDVCVFPHLEELYCASLQLYSNLERRKLERFVSANQHVRRLELDCEGTRFSSLLKMLSPRALISKYEIRSLSYNSKHVKRAQLLRFARVAHPLAAEIDFFIFLLKADDAIDLILRLNSLKYFRFRLKDIATYHYFVNRLRQAIGFPFVANLERTFLPNLSVVELTLNR